MREVDVMARIRAQFEGSGYAVLSHVRNSTGSGSVTRTADALVMSLWPSRGLTLSGFEIKVSKADWKKELSTPEKAEEIARFCDTWYVAAPPGIVRVDDLPPAWGLYETTDAKLKLVREAKSRPREEVVPITRGFLGALLRAATTDVLPKAEVEGVVQKRVEARLPDAIARHMRDAAPEHRETARKLEQVERDFARLKEAIEQFEQASGVRLLGGNTLGSIGKAVNAIRAQSHEGVARDLEAQAARLRLAADHAAEGAAELREITRIGDAPVAEGWR